MGTSGSTQIQLFYENTDIYNYNVVVSDILNNVSDMKYINPSGLTINNNNIVRIFGGPKVIPIDTKIITVDLPVGANSNNSRIRKDSFNLFVDISQSPTYITRFADGNVKPTMVVFQYSMDRSKYNLNVFYNGIKTTNPTTIYTNATSIYVELRDTSGTLLFSGNRSIGYPCTHIKVTRTESPAVASVTSTIGAISVCRNVIYNPTPV